jgi:Ca-activated chloride channel homolog
MSLRFADPLLLLVLAPVLAWLAVLFGRRSLATPALLRILALALLALALAQPQLGAERQRRTILVVDRSASIDTRMRATESSWAKQARQVCPSPCKLVEFAAEAGALPGSATELSSPLPFSTGASDLEQGLRLGLGLVPHGGSLALLSDGNETQGEALATTALARADDVRIDTVALEDERRRDVAITRMEVPTSLHSGDPLPVLLTLRSTVAAPAKLYLSLNGAAIGRESLTLRAGDNPLLLSYRATGTGWESLSARVELGGDEVPQNNSMSSTTDVLSRPRLLAVDATASLRSLLTRLGFTVTDEPARALPADAGAYADLDAVLLDDVPASAIDSSRLAALNDAVRDDGLGLVALGGAHSFSGGGYAHSGLERLLPVESLVPGDLQRRNSAIELVLDRSGSMIDLAGGYPKIEMVRAGGVQAARFAASHEDQLGIVSFDAVPHLLVPIQRLSPGAGERRVLAAIEGLTAEGGTNLYQALRAGFQQLQASSAPSKHMLLVTDGVSEPAEYKALLRTIRNAHVSVATVALGSEADHKLLETIAHATGGSYYATSSARELPQIFAKESRFAAKPTQAYGSLQVLAGADSPIVSSLGGRVLPSLQGNQLTDLKPGAQADLLARIKSGELAPVLAQWQDGAGRVAAWTPGFGAPWASAWNGETELWNDLVRWSERAPTETTLAEVLSGTPPSLRVDLARGGASASALSGSSTLSATLRSSRGTFSTLTLRRSEPGLYTAPLTGLPAGVYAFQLAGGSPLGSGELAVPYSQEYLPQPMAATPLGALAAATGGRQIAQRDPEALLAGTRQSLWWTLALAALAAFLGAVFIELLGTPRSRRGDPSSARRADSEDEEPYASTSPSRRAPAESRSSGSTSVGASR